MYAKFRESYNRVVVCCLSIVGALGFVALLWGEHLMADSPSKYVAGLPDEKAPWVTFSADGKVLAYATNNLKCGTLDPASGRTKTWVEFRESYSRAIAIQPNGLTFASGWGGQAPVVKVWDIAGGNLITTIGRKDRHVDSLALSADGKTIAVASDSGAVELVELRTGKASLSLRNPEPNGNILLCCAFCPTGKLLAVGCTDDQVRIWDIATGKLKSTLSINEGKLKGVDAVTFSLDGKILAAGSRGSRVRIWSVDSGKMLATFDPRASVLSVAIAPDGQTLAAGTAANSISLWEISSQRLKHTLKGHDRFVNSLAYSPNSKTLASGSWNGAIKLWDVATGQLLWSQQVGGSVAPR